MVVAVMGGVRAYVQNLVLKYNSPLTLAAANILIQALTIVVSIFLFDTETSFELDCGIVVSLAGYALYTMQKTMGNKKKAPSKPDVEKGSIRTEEAPLLVGGTEPTKP
mmetsp:Transcript_27449/g.74570  ORF Transcript_27449/g.74570 Transcript_27449/m.74570 type:complete len:108 (+) Transcript_27449:1383-1706(+)